MPQIARCFRALVLVLLPIALVSCGGTTGPKPKSQTKKIPVHGVVTVDGKPEAGVNVELVTKPGSGGVASGGRGTTVEDGTYHITSDVANDGAPPGEYVLTFRLTDPSKPVRIGGDTDPDDFKGKYADAKKSTHKLTVPEDAPEVDAGTIDLKK